MRYKVVALYWFEVWPSNVNLCDIWPWNAFKMYERKNVHSLFTSNVFCSSDLTKTLIELNPSNTFLWNWNPFSLFFYSSTEIYRCRIFAFFLNKILWKKNELNVTIATKRRKPYEIWTIDICIWFINKRMPKRWWVSTQSELSFSFRGPISPST